MYKNLSFTEFLCDLLGTVCKTDNNKTKVIIINNENRIGSVLCCLIWKPLYHIQEVSVCSRALRYRSAI